MKNKILMGMLLLLTLISVVGCSSKKEDVNLKNEKQILQYASRNYGKANYISKTISPDLVSFRLQDDQYKFYYECYSSKAQSCINSASCADSYYETTSCDFGNIYYDYILNELNLNNISNKFRPLYPITGGSSGNNLGKVLLALNYENEEIAKQNVKNVVLRVNKIDSRQFFVNYSISIYDNNNVYLGSYNITTHEYVSKANN